MKLKQTLLTWDAYAHGFIVTAQTVQLLYEKEEILIDEIIYLQNQVLQDSNLAELEVFTKPSLLGEKLKQFDSPVTKKRIMDCSDISEQLKVVPKIERRNVNLSNITDYQSIYINLIHLLKKEFPSDENINLHINVSPGTPQMHVVWLMLNSSGYLPVGTKIWSSQWIKELNQTTLTQVLFKPKNYLSEILKSKYLKGNLPKINPNDTTSEKRKEIEEKIELFASIPNAPILLLGERGTGKSTYVRTLIYEKQKDAHLPFAELACGTFSEELMRSELFGYEVGAFTGATKKKSGILAKFKKDGVLFLDEIHDLSKRLQRQLMQVLQTGQYYPIGAEKPEKANFRLITASNLSYNQLLSILDLDFLDRIARFKVTIPPLRLCVADHQQFWETTWTEVANFSHAPEFIWNDKIANFLCKNKLNGNFRDLQKIISYLIAYYLKFNDKDKAISAAINEFAENEIDTESNGNSYFKKDKNYSEIVANFNKDLANWAVKEYGSIKQASEKLDRSLSMLNKDMRMERLKKN